MSSIKRRALQPGDIVQYPIRAADGDRFGACLVLRRPTDDEKCVLGTGWIVANTTYFSSAPPEIDASQLREMLPCRIRGNGGLPIITLVNYRMPKAFSIAGQLELSASEAQAECRSVSTWDYLPDSRLAEWRWENDRKALIAEWEADETRLDEERLQFEAHRKQAIQSFTLQDIPDYIFFRDWDGVMPKRATAAIREIIMTSANELLDLGEGASDVNKLAVLQMCVESLNTLDEKRDYIDTLERETIIEELERLQNACGLGHLPDLIDRWRAW